MEGSDDLDFLMGDESLAEEDRSDEIKQALAELDETFQDEDESVHSLVLDENGRVETPSPVNGINGRKYDDDDVISFGLPRKVRFENIPEESIQGSKLNEEDQQVQVQPSTLSFLHQGHCPRPPAPIDKINNGTKQNHEDFDKLYAIIDFREKQVQQFEQDAEAYAKDKRSLNHQIGLMKTEMNQMKIHNDELEKALLLQNEEIGYLKAKMTEALEEYDQIRKQEVTAREESDRHADEVAKLKQQVEMLSSIGSALQSSEMNDVVRQIRDKHAKEISVWQETSAELERQLHLMKRNQQHLHDTSIIIEKENKAVQTENQRPRSITHTLKVRTADFGQMVNFLMDPQTEDKRKVERGAGDGDTNSSHRFTDADAKLVQKWKDTVEAVEEEKNRLMDYYEREINEYKTKLAVLPSELYTIWTKQQEELGLFGSSSGRHSVSAISPRLVNNWTQTNSSQKASLRSSTDTQSLMYSITSQKTISKSSISPQTTSRESVAKSTTSVIVQTDETLETFDMLGEVIQSWAKEVALSAKRADVAEQEVSNVMDRYKALQVAFLKVKRDWKDKEKYWRKKYDDQRINFVSILSRVSSKLDIVESNQQ
ncbi:unnamed protein product [Allacma fusca]|uniref:Uncharacterized protein n=1 Tax=Allacma fusca TaxID=39272 RepID=A0A8J2L3E6_9HEXA|nr:unnamed protein product [Allacma fusca]